MHSAEHLSFATTVPSEPSPAKTEVPSDPEIDMASILDQLQAADEAGALDQIIVTATELAADEPNQKWLTKHVTAASKQVEKLNKLPQVFETVLGGLATSLSVLPNFLQAAAAICPHCIVPIAQMAGQMGNLAGTASSFNLGGLPGGHFHADGTWHADSEHDHSVKKSPQRTSPKKHHQSQSETTINPWGRGFGVVGFGLIELFMQSLIPDTQPA